MYQAKSVCHEHIIHQQFMSQVYKIVNTDGKKFNPMTPPYAILAMLVTRRKNPNSFANTAKATACCF